MIHGSPRSPWLTPRGKSRLAQLSEETMWEHEPLYPCPVPLKPGEAHDGGGALGPLYLVMPPVDMPEAELPIAVACAACCARMGQPTEHVVVWPPRETL